MACGNVFETEDEDVFHCEACLKRMHSDLQRFIIVLEKKPDPDSESKVKIQIVQPILEKLGWDIKNDSYVAPEYKLKMKGSKNNYKYADYGLLIPKFKKSLRCIIEVKTPGKLSGSFLDDAEHQLLQYAFIANVPLAVLTDGLRWKFYLPSAGEDKHVCTLDLKKDPSDEVVSKLVRYLSFENTISNKSTKNAKSDLNERVMKEEIFQAWEKLLASDKLIDLLIKETRQISGDTPERQYVKEFLDGLITGGGEDRKDVKVKKEPTRPASSTEKKVSGKKFSFFLLGEYTEEKDRASAFIKIMETLAERDQGFLERLAPEVEGEINKPLSRNLEDIAAYARGQAKPLPGGWWFTTHSSTDVKKSMLRTACKIAEIPFEKHEGLKLVRF